MLVDMHFANVRLLSDNSDVSHDQTKLHCPSIHLHATQLFDSLSGGCILPPLLPAVIVSTQLCSGALSASALKRFGTNFSPLLQALSSRSPLLHAAGRGLVHGCAPSLACMQVASGLDPSSVQGRRWVLARPHVPAACSGAGWYAGQQAG